MKGKYLVSVKRNGSADLSIINRVNSDLTVNFEELPLLYLIQMERYEDAKAKLNNTSLSYLGKLFNSAPSEEKSAYVLGMTCKDEELRKDIRSFAKKYRDHLLSRSFSAMTAADITHMQREFYLAVSHNKLRMVHKIFAFFPEDDKDLIFMYKFYANNRNPLLGAAKKGYTEIIDFLLENMPFYLSEKLCNDRDDEDCNFIEYIDEDPCLKILSGVYRIRVSDIDYLEGLIKISYMRYLMNSDLTIDFAYELLDMIECDIDGYKYTLAENTVDNLKLERVFLETLPIFITDEFCDALSQFTKRYFDDYFEVIDQKAEENLDEFANDYINNSYLNVIREEKGPAML